MIHRSVPALVASALLAFPLLAQQEERITIPTASYTWSDPGNSVSGGVSGTVTSAGGEFRFKLGPFRSVELIYEQLTIDQKTLQFCAPRDPGSFVQPSTSYPGAERCTGGSDTAPGIDITHNSGCNIVTGSFDVDEMLHDYYGWPVLFSATFSQNCEGNPPALTGSVEAELGTLGATSLTPGNLLVAMVNRLFEVDRDGNWVQSIPILVDTDTNPSELHDGDEAVRDLVIDDLGNVFLFNGTGTGTTAVDEVQLTVFGSLQGTWDHYDGATGWSVWESPSDSPAYGGLALFGDYVFASDTIRSGDEVGIVRFDRANGFNAQRFADTQSYIDLALGLDGLLYALRLDNLTVDVFDPSTVGLDAVGGAISLTGTTDIVAIAVDASGNIYGIETFGDIHRFDGTGASQQELDVSFFEATDLDIEADGTLIGAAQAQKLVFSSTALSSFDIVDLPDPSPNNISMPGLEVVHVAVIPDLPFFIDGFESGDTTSWDVVQP